MIGHHYLVGTITLLLGLFSLGAALKNDAWFFQLAKLQRLQAAVGRAKSRWICGVLGCGLILLGLCILAGRLPRKISPVRSATLRSEFDNAEASFAC